MAKTRFLVFIALALTMSCVTTKVASPDQDRDAKKFTPPSGQANVYIQRKSETFGGLLAFDVLVDGKKLASLPQGTYLVVSLDPGSHQVVVNAGINSTSLPVSVEANKNYYYTVGAKAGSAILQPEISLVLLEAMGKLMILQSQRAVPADTH